MPQAPSVQCGRPSGAMPSGAAKRSAKRNWDGTPALHVTQAGQSIIARLASILLYLQYLRQTARFALSFSESPKNPSTRNYEPEGRMFESCRAHHKIKRSKDLRRSVAGLRRRRDLLVLTQKVCREYKWVIFRERRGMIRDSPAERTPRVLTNCRTYPIARDSPQPVFASSERTCREALTATVASCLARLLWAAPTQPPAGRSNGPAPWSSQPDHTSRLSD